MDTKYWLIMLFVMVMFHARVKLLLFSRPPCHRVRAPCIILGLYTDQPPPHFSHSAGDVLYFSADAWFLSEI